MARTLIGNIKGKDGRGITSIKKTGTTGPVDTYTITYTDSTTSTFTVNNSDNIALQRQIVPSAAVESSATASQAYEAGDYVVVNGILRKAKSAIAKGNTISDSNSTATTVTGELASSASQIASQPVTKRGREDKVITAQYGIAAMIVGSAVVTVSNSNKVKLFTAAQFNALAGREFDKEKDFVGVMNGDYNGPMAAHVQGTGYANDGSIYAYIEGNWNTVMRINYLIVLGA